MMAAAPTPDVKPPRAGAGGMARYALVALALAAVGLAAFALTDTGNNLGIDDWIHYYHVLHNGSIRFADRPLSLILLGAVQPLAGASYAAYHVVALAVRIVSAAALALVVWRLNPDAPEFAFACGALFLVFFVDDFFLLLTPMYIADSLGSLLAVSLALAVFTVGLTADEMSLAGRIATLVGGAALGYAAALVRENGVPLLLGIPILAVLSRRRVSRVEGAGLGAWYAAVLAASARFVLPLFGVGRSTYGVGLYQDLGVTRMAWATFDQFSFAFRQVVITNLVQVYPYRFAALTTGGVTLAALSAVRSAMRGGGPAAVHRHRAVLRYGLWSLGGLAATFLGFAAFLPTRFARDPIRTHVLAMPGEAVFLAAAIWAISYLARGVRWRWIARYAGVFLIALYGASVRGRVQQQIYDLGGTWDNTAHFMRSLSHLVPAVDDLTLIVNVENPETVEAPWTSGFSFQYALRTFYDDEVTGIMTTDNILGSWEARADGIYVEEDWNGPHLFGWDEVIVITRDEAGRVMILDKLPPDLYTPERQRQYDPYGHIVRGYIPPRVRRTFPIVESPDLSGSADE
jgi:hypothetical protein